MNRKVFVSILGTGFYATGKYFKDDFISSETRFVQQATIEYIRAEHWTEEDVILTLLTGGARNNNWDNKLVSRFNIRTNKNEPYAGLLSVLTEMNLKCGIQDISIPDGKNEAEMWQIFTLLFNELKNGDELYFDLTHSYRYLPMLILVFGNYAKFLKDVTVKYISYGNYEARDLETNMAPIMDLFPLIALQDWTFAAANFRNFGKMGELTTSISSVKESMSKATKSERRVGESIIKLKNNIDEFEKRISTCRGQALVKGDAVMAIKQNIDVALGTKVPQPLQEILKSLKVGISQFSDETHDNLICAINWCIKYNMIQQAYTLGQESLITILCKKMDAVNPYHGNKAGERNFRDYIASILGIDIKYIADETKWSGSLASNRLLSRAFFSLDWVKQLRKPYGKLLTNRNQINHAGFTGMIKTAELINPLQRIIEECFAILNNPLELPVVKEPNEKLIINFSNHPYALWSQKQREAAKIYGECIDLPFPNITPSLDEREIEQLAEEYLKKILEMSGESQLTVHVMGEFTFCCLIAFKLRKYGIRCLASCAERNVEIVGSQIKQVVFEFERFREYEFK